MTTGGIKFVVRSLVHARLRRVCLNSAAMMLIGVTHTVLFNSLAQCARACTYVRGTWAFCAHDLS